MSCFFGHKWVYSQKTTYKILDVSFIRYSSRKCDRCGKKQRALTYNMAYDSGDWVTVTDKEYEEEY